MNLDKNDLEKLWDDITPKLYGYLLHTLRDEALADDILQTTWLKAIEALPQFHDRGYGFSPWLFSIAKNEMRMHWRKNGREISYDPLLHDKQEDRTQGKEKEENKVLAEQVIRRLPPEDQELIRLRYIADLPLGAMAKLLKQNPITVRVKMHRALSRARLIFKEKMYE
jgi:RNA polymerase sigma-70 factor, ECF subfamily